MKVEWVFDNAQPHLQVIFVEYPKLLNFIFIQQSNQKWNCHERWIENFGEALIDGINRRSSIESTTESKI